MLVNKNVPNLRFPEFSGVWLTRKLDEVFYERQEKGGVDRPMLSVTIKNGVVPFDSIDRKDNSNSDKSKYKQVEPDDIAYNSMRMWQGASGIVTSPGIVSPAYTVLRPKKGQFSRFYSYYFKLPQLVNMFERYSQGLTSDTWNLKFSQLAEIRIFAPEVEEQQKISDFLVSVDDRISLLQKKKELLEKYKKGVMQKIFSQDIRFRDEGGKDYLSWQAKMLVEITNNFDNKRKPISSEKRMPGDVPYYGANGIVGYVETHIFDGEYVLVAEDGVVDVTKYPIHLVNGKFWANNHAHVLQGRGVSNVFLYYALQNTKFARYITGSAQTKLNNKVLGKIDINLPTEEEQCKIADFLTSLDEKIEAEEGELVQAKQFKKGLLQQMFV